MTTTLSLPSTPIEPRGENRVIFHNLNWSTYQQILHALPGNRAARLTYDRGTLEITMPSELHEFSGELIALFIRILVIELGLKIKTMGSTTLDREDLNRGAEPDKAFYIQNQPAVAGRRVDLSQDPPPDLVVEVEISHSDIDKLKLYAAMGVPEFWRYNGKILRIYQLQGGLYHEVEQSPTFPQVPKTRLYQFLSEGQADEIAAEHTLRNWLRSL
ncbi:MAG: Uma2 family endonuclease [Prochlorotrichaceae cyanobacterium]